MVSLGLTLSGNVREVVPTFIKCVFTCREVSIEIHSFLPGKTIIYVSKKLYVGNLSYDTTDETLREAFSKAGVVEEASVLKDQGTGRSRGFGFVTMADDAGGDNAIQMYNDQELDGRRLKVNEARPKTDRPPRRSFGGGGGSGGGFGRGPRNDY